ncbi:MAG: tetratricopeptide repeat protein, partial [Chloroflexota bacterium]|nr:tetratricopeptide repeat protein [Chloroflexota bacterium]
MPNESLPFAALLTQFRMGAGLTQQELAERARLSARGISDLERGVKIRPRAYTVLQLADALELSTEQRAVFQRAARPQDAAPELPAAPAAPVPLPTPLTPLIGRERDEAEVIDLFRWRGARLVTLIGPGGVGKTRLALEAARRLRDDFKGKVALVALGSIREPGLLPAVVVEALGLQQEGSRSSRAILIDYLQQRRALLVLDNFEHVLEAAPYVADLLAACPSVRVLATSRTPLCLRGEREVWIEPLALPEVLGLEGGEEVARSPAVALFLSSAQVAQPGLSPHDTHSVTIADICRRLDGLPLALELAAVHLRTMSPDTLLARLEHRLQVLADGPRDLPTRQQTMRDTIAWSYDLLTQREQIVFRRLSVVAGGCTAEVAGAICCDDLSPADILSTLGSLAEKSLLRIQEQENGELRFSPLETIREYALERLVAVGEEITVRRRHLAYFVALAEEAEPQLQGAEQPAWLKRLSDERDNLRAALHSARGTGDLAQGLRLASALWQFWYTHGYLREGRRWMESLLELEAVVGTPESHALRAQACVRAAILATEAGDHSQAAALAGEGLARYRTTEDKRGMGVAWNVLGNVAKYQGELRRAAEFYEQSMDVMRDIGSTVNVARLLNNLGTIAVERGDFQRAVALYEESLAIKRELEDERGIATALNNLADVFRDQGHLDRASSLYRESMQLFQHMGEKSGAALSLANLGEVTRYQGDLREARTLCEESVRLAREVGNAWIIAVSLKTLGEVLQDQGEQEHSAVLLRESLTIYRDTDNQNDAIECLEAIAGLEQARGRLERAATLWNA